MIEGDHLETIGNPQDLDKVMAQLAATADNNDPIHQEVLLQFRA